MEYSGFYRGVVKEVVDKKNGLYRVKVYPFFGDVDDVSKLPVGCSNMTNSRGHISLRVGDVVWVFFENGRLEFPVIFSFCNVKDRYPKWCSGERGDYYDSIVSNSEIGENEVSYSGEYNKVDGFEFGDIKVEFDMKNKQVVFFVGGRYFVLDKDGNLHIKVGKCFVNSDGVGVGVGSGFYVRCDGGVDGGVSVVMGSSGKLLLKNNSSNFCDVLDNIYNCFSLLNTALSSASVEGKPLTINLGGFISEYTIFKSNYENLIKNT